MTNEKVVNSKNKTEYMYIRFNFVTLFLLAAAFVILSDGELDTTGIVVRLERVLCTCSKYCTWTMCKVKFKSRDVAELNVIATLKTQVSALKFTIKMFYKFSNNEYRPIFIDTEIDFCAIQEGGSASPVYNAIMIAYANYSNLYQRCPFMPGQYYVKDFNFQASYLPSIFPAGRYLINSTGRMQSNEWLYNTSIYFEISNHGIKDLRMGGNVCNEGKV